MKDKNKLKKYICYAMIGVTSGVLNGLFGAGGGCVVVPAMEKFLVYGRKKVARNGNRRNFFDVGGQLGFIHSRRLV